MPGIEDWVNSPLSIIQRLFEENPEKHIENVKEYFCKKLCDNQAMSWVPSLNDVPLHDLRTGTLVRFRCMVQDMYDPEFYLGAYEVENMKSGQRSLRCGKFQDLAECSKNEELRLDSPNNITLDRQTIYCVPIPGENTWVKQMYADQNKSAHSHGASSSSNSRPKRSHDDEHEEGMDQSESRTDPEAEGSSRAKGDASEAGSNKDEDGEEKKKAKTASESETKSTSPPDLNFPLPGEKGPACLVKMYEGSESVKLNDAMEFIGVICNDPALVVFPDKESNGQSAMLEPAEELMECPEEQSAHSPPPSLVPRLHVLLANKLQHNNPLLPPGANLEQDLHSVLPDLDSVRSQLKAYLQSAMLGDELAAEYLLCHLVSTVYARHDVVALGKFSLNLSGCPRDSVYSSAFYNLLKELCTKSHLLPMSLESMNSLAFLPRKDYKANRLTSGLLQLAGGTHLVADETALQPGQLDTKGVANLTELGNVVTWQKLDYDFNFHKQEFKTNLNILVLSEGKSLLRCDCHVPMSVQAPPSADPLERVFADLRAAITPAVRDQFRNFLTVLKLLPYTLSDELQKAIEQDFVDARKDNASNMTVDDLHGLLVLARLLSLTHGKSALSKEMWDRARQLETQRKTRIEALPSRTN